jgi:CubicO group peptidase (beta-lactamase class C family)
MLRNYKYSKKPKRAPGLRTLAAIFRTTYLMKTFIFCLTIFVLPLILYGQTTKEFKVDSILNEYFPDGFNGNILFASNDSIIFKKSYGYKDLKTKDPLNDSSIFELASCSKQFTALAILKLQELGKISIHDSLRAFIPELPFYGVTIYQLATHTSGVPDYHDYLAKSKIIFPSNEDIIKLLSSSKLDFKPGDKWAYSNTGYILLASIIERTSGLSFNDFLQKYFFKPLGMTHTRVYNTLYSKNEILPNYAYGHERPKGRLRYFKSEKRGYLKYWTYRTHTLIGQGRISTTTFDLVKWDNGLRNYKILSKESLKLAYDSVELNNGQKKDYGFGYFLYSDKKSGRIMIHTGFFYGYESLIYRSIDLNKILIILNNKVYHKNRPVKAGNKINLLLSGTYKNSG